METRAETVSGLQELSDPDFFGYWALVRQRYALAPDTSPGRQASRRDYDAVLAEYRRRMDGA